MMDRVTMLETTMRTLLPLSAHEVRTLVLAQVDSEHERVRFEDEANRPEVTHHALCLAASRAIVAQRLRESLETYWRAAGALVVAIALTACGDGAFTPTLVGPSPAAVSISDPQPDSGSSDLDAGTTDTGVDSSTPPSGDAGGADPLGFLFDHMDATAAVDAGDAVKDATAPYVFDMDGAPQRFVVDSSTNTWVCQNPGYMANDNPLAPCWIQDASAQPVAPPWWNGVVYACYWAAGATMGPLANPPGCQDMYNDTQFCCLVP